MRINFPSFPDERFVGLVICAHLHNASGEQKQLIRDVDGDLVAYYVGNYGRQYLTLTCDGEDDTHVHLEIDSAQFAKPREKTNSKKADIEAVMDSLRGAEVDCNIRAAFLVPMSDLSEHGIIKASMVESSIGNVSLKMSGGMLKVIGGPVTQLRWFISPSEDEAIITLTARQRTNLDETYISRQINSMSENLNLFVLRDNTDAETDNNDATEG